MSSKYKWGEVEVYNSSPIQILMDFTGVCAQSFSLRISLIATILLLLQFLVIAMHDSCLLVYLTRLFFKKFLVCSWVTNAYKARYTIGFCYYTVV